MFICQISNQIVRMKALCCDDDGACHFVVEAGNQCRTEPFVDGVALRLRHRVRRLERIIDDDDIRSSTGQRATDRSGDSRSSTREHDLAFRVLPAPNAGRGKYASVPIRRYYGPVVILKFHSQVLSIRDADDVAGWIMTMHKCREGDRGANGLPTARRHRQYEPSDFF